MRRIGVLFIAGGLAIGLAACEEEGQEPTGPTGPTEPTPSGGASTGEAPGNVRTVAINTVCPISGEPVDEAVTVAHETETIAFCCTDCRDEWDGSDEAARAALAAKARGGTGGGEGGEQTGG